MSHPGITSASKGGTGPSAVRRTARDILELPHEQEIPARELLPGDLVILATGAAVPADIRIAAGTDVRVDESVLTGESVPVRKRTEAEEHHHIALLPQYSNHAA